MTTRFVWSFLFVATAAAGSNLHQSHSALIINWFASQCMKPMPYFVVGRGIIIFALISSCHCCHIWKRTIWNVVAKYIFKSRMTRVYGHVCLYICNTNAFNKIWCEIRFHSKHASADVACVRLISACWTHSIGNTHKLWIYHIHSLINITSRAEKYHSLPDNGTRSPAMPAEYSVGDVFRTGEALPEIFAQR